MYISMSHKSYSAAPVQINPSCNLTPPQVPGLVRLLEGTSIWGTPYPLEKDDRLPHYGPHTYCRYPIFTRQEASTVDTHQGMRQTKRQHIIRNLVWVMGPSARDPNQVPKERLPRFIKIAYPRVPTLGYLLCIKKTRPSQAARHIWSGLPHLTRRTQ